MIGEALGNYRITAKLGSGAMGVVYRAEHARIARTAALKVLLPELAQSESAVQRFFTEARATSLIRHPGIVEVFDCDLDSTGRAYIVMEYLDGETLADRLRRSNVIPWAVACDVARQVAEAIAEAHDRGIIHRDLKPENVFLVGGPVDSEAALRVKVLDFGIAKLRTADASGRLTMRGMVLGSPEYMAPEQCIGSDELDARADIYALGCILFEMLSGEPPFIAETFEELLAAHTGDPVPSIGELIPELPAWLAGLVTIMLAKRKDERPTSMRAVAAALAGTMEAAPFAHRPAGRRSAVRSTPIVLALGGVAALGVAAWSAVRWISWSPPQSTLPQAALPVSRALERVTPPPTTSPAIVFPAPAALAPAASPRAAVSVSPAVEPSARKRSRAFEQPRRPVPSKAPPPKHPVDTDGIVDL
jgi:serine/threonine-protein kinase